MQFNPGERSNLPILICKEFVLFPDCTNTIFAQRSFSKKAIEIALKERDNYVVVVTQLNNNKDTDLDIQDLNKVATLCRVASSIGTDTLKLRCIGLERVSIEELIYDESLDCYFANFVLDPDTFGDEKEEVAIVSKLIEYIQNSNKLRLDAQTAALIKNNLSVGTNALKLSYVLASNLPFRTSEKLELLNLSNVNDRLLQIYAKLDGIVEDVKIEEKIQNAVRENAEKNQKEYFLREKLRAIHQELGDEDDENDFDELKDKIEKGPYPDYIKTKVKDELKRYRMMPQASLEASLIKNYIDVLMSIPWFEKTTDNDDLDNVQKVLDEDHYGIEKPKERIIEYIAVKSHTNSLKAPILCLYGPPGVGKTSLAKSVARALGRKFVKSSLGGVNDESEIRGHRRTYVGSMPGRIIQGMRRAKTVNPVFLLDEIDKVGSSYKGDPASALLEVLDPEQNFAFNDNYVEEPYDLSNVLFICTANYLGNIPAPLRDRLELIEMNSYTQVEKLHIAKEHLIKKQCLENGLDPEKVEFNDDAIDYIIEHYTAEAGVRSLERCIGKICRKIVVAMVKNKSKRKVKITIAKVKEYLGTEIFEVTKKESEPQVGVVTGLAYTEIGGTIMNIEVNNFPGKGNLVLTGKLGDVMKESCSIAFDYLKAHADKYKIPHEAFTNNDIHIHFPEGAVPKDGPSAGCAITVAIASCLTNRPVRDDVAMTGEVTLRGKALPIGGLREKSLAALKSGIKNILIPRENERNFNDLPSEVKDQMKVTYLDNVDQAIEICLR